MSKSLTNQEFIKRSKEVHGEKYEYSLTQYKNAKEKVVVTCPIHGEFEVLPYNHLKGCDCKRCGREKLSKAKRSNTTEFLENARKVHGEKYDYSKIDYTKSGNKIKVICPEHGEFQIRASHFLQGHGCRKCSDKKSSSSTEQFIQRAKELHGSKYDYSLVDYTNNNQLVTIICPIHGKFTRTPRSHLNGQACNLCSKKERGLKRRMSTEEFIHKAKEVHGDSYDYSSSHYKKTGFKIKIICPIHGEFLQSPNSHLRGHGCPNCFYSKGEQRTQNFLEKNNINYSSQKWFPDCRNINPLPFDFAIYDKENNLKFLIEYDGRQHFRPTSFGGGCSDLEIEKQFKKTKKHDKIKTNYCLKQGISLLRITYKEFNHIESILEKYLELD